MLMTENYHLFLDVLIDFHQDMRERLLGSFSVNQKIDSVFGTFGEADVRERVFSLCKYS